MRTIVRITNDYNSTLSFDMWKEDLTNLVDEIDILCEVSNRDYRNPIKSTGSEDDYKNSLSINAHGYSKSDWQEYVIHYNELSDEVISQLTELLEKSFTHKNDYWVEKFEQTEINGKVFNADPHDYTSFCINHIEFPDGSDIKNEYNNIYGVDYDDMIIEVD